MIYPKEEGTKLVYQFNFTAWPDSGVPRNPDSVVQFLTVVNNKQEELAAPGPIIIHCRSGTNRSYTVSAKVKEVISDQMKVKERVKVKKVISDSHKKKVKAKEQGERSRSTCS